nr:nuclear transport factor 2 family protein [Ruegeria sp. R13_0]
MPAVIDRYVSAYNARDVDAMLECLDESIEFQNTSEGEGNASAHNKAEFRELAIAALELFSSRKQEIIEFITVGPFTTARVSFLAMAAVDIPNGPTAGAILQLSGTSLFEIKDNKIVRLIDES